MRKLKLCIGLWLTILVSGSQVLAQNSEAIQSSIFKLKTTELCATAFVSKQGDLITTAHALKGLCSSSECSGFWLEDASSHKHSETNDIWQVQARLLTLDIIALRNSKRNLSGSFNLVETGTLPEATLELAGFPSCRERTKTKGSIEHSGPLHLLLSHRGLQGSSGSPLFDSNLNVFGVVDEARSASEALLGQSAALPFRLRAVKAELLSKIKSLEPEAALAAELKELNAYYKDFVAKSSGLERLWLSSSFIAMLDRARRLDLFPAQFKDAAWFISALGQFPAMQIELWPQYSPSDLYNELALASTAYNLESKGPFASFGKVINPLNFSEGLETQLSFPKNQSGRHAELLQAAQLSGFPGIWLFTYKLIAWFCLLSSAC